MPTGEVPLELFSRIWIVPQDAVIYEKDNSVFLLNSHLKVMAEEQYQGGEFSKDQTLVKDDVSRVLQNTILPLIEHEVNHGESFVPLRQIFNSLILAVWYKNALKDSLLTQIYADKNTTTGVDVADTKVRENQYQEYMKVFQDGANQFIKEDYDPDSQSMITRQYITGGVDAAQLAQNTRTIDAAQMDETPQDLVSLNGPATFVNVDLRSDTDNPSEDNRFQQNFRIPHPKEMDAVALNEAISNLVNKDLNIQVEVNPFSGSHDLEVRNKNGTYHIQGPILHVHGNSTSAYVVNLNSIGEPILNLVRNYDFSAKVPEYVTIKGYGIATAEFKALADHQFRPYTVLLQDSYDSFLYGPSLVDSLKVIGENQALRYHLAEKIDKMGLIDNEGDMDFSNEALWMVDEDKVSWRGVVGPDIVNRVLSRIYFDEEGRDRTISEIKAISEFIKGYIDLKDVNLETIQATPSLNLEEINDFFSKSELSDNVTILEVAGRPVVELRHKNLGSRTFIYNPILALKEMPPLGRAKKILGEKRYYAAILDSRGDVNVVELTKSRGVSPLKGDVAENHLGFEYVVSEGSFQPYAAMLKEKILSDLLHKSIESNLVGVLQKAIEHGALGKLTKEDWVYDNSSNKILARHKKLVQDAFESIVQLIKMDETGEIRSQEHAQQMREFVNNSLENRLVDAAQAVDQESVQNSKPLTYQEVARVVARIQEDHSLNTITIEVGGGVNGTVPHVTISGEDESVLYQGPFSKFEFSNQTLQFVREKDPNFVVSAQFSEAKQAWVLKEESVMTNGDVRVALASAEGWGSGYDWEHGVVFESDGTADGYVLKRTGGRASPRQGFDESKFTPYEVRGPFRAMAFQERQLYIHAISKNGQSVFHDVKGAKTIAEQDLPSNLKWVSKMSFPREDSAMMTPQKWWAYVTAQNMIGWMAMSHLLFSKSQTDFMLKTMGLDSTQANIRNAQYEQRRLAELERLKKERESDPAVLISAKDVGGIDLDPAMLNMTIKRDGNGVVLPISEQPPEVLDIKALYPVITDMVPIVNVPLQLGLVDEAPNDADQNTNTKTSEIDLSPADRKDRLSYLKS